MSTAAKAMKTSSEVPMQAPSREIWDAKYRLKDRHGQPVDQDVAATFERVARALAAVEGEKADEWLPKFPLGEFSLMREPKPTSPPSV
jgi:ribonucleoside-diphosphate reductase alpha chain